jgi:hypothetical protein
MKTREEMINDIIKQYGFESKWTIWFCNLAEQLTDDSALLNAYIILKAGVNLE